MRGRRAENEGRPRRPRVTTAAPTTAFRKPSSPDIETLRVRSTVVAGSAVFEAPALHAADAMSLVPHAEAAQLGRKERDKALLRAIYSQANAHKRRSAEAEGAVRRATAKNRMKAAMSAVCRGASTVLQEKAALGSWNRAVGEAREAKQIEPECLNRELHRQGKTWAKAGQLVRQVVTAKSAFSAGGTFHSMQRQLKAIIQDVFSGEDAGQAQKIVASLEEVARSLEAMQTRLAELKSREHDALALLASIQSDCNSVAAQSADRLAPWRESIRKRELAPFGLLDEGAAEGAPDGAVYGAGGGGSASAQLSRQLGEMSSEACEVLLEDLEAGGVEPCREDLLEREVQEAARRLAALRVQIRACCRLRARAGRRPPDLSVGRVSPQAGGEGGWAAGGRRSSSVALPADDDQGPANAEALEDGGLAEALEDLICNHAEAELAFGAWQIGRVPSPHEPGGTGVTMKSLVDKARHQALAPVPEPLDELGDEAGAGRARGSLSLSGEAAKLWRPPPPLTVPEPHSPTSPSGSSPGGANAAETAVTREEKAQRWHRVLSAATRDASHRGGHGGASRVFDGAGIEAVIAERRQRQRIIEIVQLPPVLRTAAQGRPGPQQPPPPLAAGELLPVGPELAAGPPHSPRPAVVAAQLISFSAVGGGAPEARWQTPRARKGPKVPPLRQPHDYRSPARRMHSLHA